jgi:hypothetical protein
MNELQLTVHNLVHVFNSRRDSINVMHIPWSIPIRPNLELKTQQQQRLGSILLDVRCHAPCSNSTSLKLLQESSVFVSVNHSNPSLIFVAQSITEFLKGFHTVSGKFAHKY